MAAFFVLRTAWTAAIIVGGAITLHFFYKKSIDTYQTKLFSVLIGLELVSSALDLVTMYTIGHPQVLTRTWHRQCILPIL
jgi:hypothetical protein